jgi:hypothetical protein
VAARVRRCQQCSPGGGGWPVSQAVPQAAEPTANASGYVGGASGGSSRFSRWFQVEEETAGAATAATPAAPATEPGTAAASAAPTSSVGATPEVPAAHLTFQDLAAAALASGGANPPAPAAAPAGSRFLTLEDIEQALPGARPPSGAAPAPPAAQALRALQPAQGLPATTDSGSRGLTGAALLSLLQHGAGGGSDAGGARAGLDVNVSQLGLPALQPQVCVPRRAAPCLLLRASAAMMEDVCAGYEAVWQRGGPACSQQGPVRGGGV